jgi:hypothetical protein
MQLLFLPPATVKRDRVDLYSTGNDGAAAVAPLAV